MKLSRCCSFLVPTPEHWNQFWKLVNKYVKRILWGVVIEWITSLSREAIKTYKVFNTTFC